MPVSLSPTPVTGTGPPGDTPDQSAASSPPGAADQFATVLLQSGNPKSLTGVLPTDKGTQNTAKPDAQTQLLLSALKKLGAASAKSPDLSSSIPGQSSPPTNLAVTLAAAQNAMDTLPASLSSKDKSETQKQDGELLLPTDQTSAPVVLPAPSALLPQIVVPVLSAASVPSPVAQNAGSSTAAQAITSVTSAALPLPKTFAISSPALGNATAKAVEQASLGEQPHLAAESSQASAVVSSQASAVVSSQASSVVTSQAAAVEASSTPLTLAAATGIDGKSNGNKAASSPVSQNHSELPSSATSASPLPPLPAVPSPVTSGMAPSPDAILALQAQPAVQSAQAVLIGTQVKTPATDDAKSLLVTGKAALTEKPLKTTVETADTNTVTNTRLQAIAQRQVVLPEAQSATAARQSDKSANDPNSPQVSALALDGSTSSSRSSSVSQAVTTAPLSHAEQVQIAKQAGDGIGAITPPSRPGDAQQMTIQLHPKDWGKLQVSVTLAPQTAADAVAGQKTVSAHIIVDSPQVKAALENQTGELRTAMRSSGMHLDQITVSVQSAKTVDAPTAANNSQWQQGNSGSADPQSSQNGQPGGSAFASFAGNSQGRNQGHSPNLPAAYRTPETDDSLELAAPRQLMLGQIDTRA